MSTPDLSTVIADAIKYQLGEVNTAIPARIIKYDPTKQEAEVEPLIKRRYKDGKVVKRAAITGVPVVFPAAGGGIITFPVQAGDTVLLIFAQRSIDRWLRSEGEPIDPGDNRKHDISDAMAIPGLFTLNTALQSDPDNVIIKFSGASIALTPAGAVEISAPGGLTIDADTQHNGDINIDGTSDASGDHVSDGISGKGHKHTQPNTTANATTQGDTGGPK